MKEEDGFVASKTKAALDGGLGVILCCGETLEEREAGKTIDVVTRQLRAVAEKTKEWGRIVVAYEPVWYVVMLDPWDYCEGCASARGLT